MPDELTSATPQYYGDYLGIERLLELQKPLSLREGKLIAHDEMLFIIIHQAYELWFKQILHEITACKEVLSKPEADDDGPDMNVVVHRLDRVVEIWKLLNHQVDVLETMTPLDFLEFRELLHGASGFQSKQFRQIEASLGLKVENRFRPDYYKHTRFGGFNEQDMAEITAFEEQETLLGLVEKWLERMPFFGAEFWEGWEETPTEAGQGGPVLGPLSRALRPEPLRPRREDRPARAVRRHLLPRRLGAISAGRLARRTLHHALPRRADVPASVRAPQLAHRDR